METNVCLKEFFLAIRKQFRWQNYRDIIYKSEKLRVSDYCVLVKKKLSDENNFTAADRICEEANQPQMHIFAQERPEGRHFVCGSVKSFYDHFFSQTFPRCWHMVVRKNMPCPMLYYDIDWKPGVVSGMQLLKVFHTLIDLVMIEIFETRDYRIVECESSNETKFSVHGIVRCNWIMFKNSIMCGQFMMVIELVARMLGYYTLFSWGENKTTIFFPNDPQIYHANHTLRTIGSTKTDAPRYFWPMPPNIDHYQPLSVKKDVPPPIDFETFYGHLINDIEPLQKNNLKIVEFRCSPEEIFQSVTTTFYEVKPIESDPTTTPLINGSAIHTRIVDHINKKEDVKVNGKKVLLTKDGNLILPTNSHVCRIAQFLRAKNETVEHQSNFIYFYVNMDRHTYSQRCHDEVCSMAVRSAFVDPCKHAYDETCKACRERQFVRRMEQRLPEQEIWGESPELQVPESRSHPPKRKRPEYANIIKHMLSETKKDD
jgi:hypothetical protein